MRKLMMIATLGLVTSIGWAQDGTTTDAAAQGQSLLKDVVSTYVNADALSDSLAIAYTMPGQPEESMDVTVMIDRSSGSSKYDGGGTTITALDGQFYLETADVSAKYLQVELQNDVATTMRSLFGGSGLPFHFVLNDGATVDDLTSALNVGQITDLSIAGVETKTNDAGEKLSVVTMRGADDGTLTLEIDPETNLIHKTVTVFTPPMQMGGGSGSVTISTAYEPTLSDELPAAITFDPAGRRSVSTIQALVTLSKGDQAPDFTLTTSTGDEVTLSDLRGNVVVLDFWATWCGPCKMGLPLLQKFHTWTVENDKPIKVFGLNGGQREATAEARREAATSYWTSQEFTMPTLIDTESSVFRKYVSGGIPLTVVIDPQGVVADVHVGYDPKMVESLKQATAEALAAVESAG